MDSRAKRIKEFNLHLAKLIKGRRLERRLTQAELARYLNISQSTLSRIEKGQLEVSLDLFLALSVPLGLSMEDLRP